MKIKITKLPLDKAQYGKQVDGALSLKANALSGRNYQPASGVNKSLSSVPREDANLEAEGGETAFGPISGQSIPDHMIIKGKRHHEGGVPLNLPDDTFIFSDTASLKINEPSVLAMFNKVPKKGGYTPAELAKPYDIQKYKDILYDKDSGKLEKNTAIIMIKNYIMKLGALALVQESMKGFPQGIPEMAAPYMEANDIRPEDLMPELKEQADAMTQQQQMMQQQQMAPEMQQGMPQEQMMDQGMSEEDMYPEQMPSGAPVASPEALAQMQNMQMQPDMGQMPMAAYGMTMGASYFPYSPDDMYSYQPFTYNDDGLLKAQDGPQVDEELLKRFSGNRDAYDAYTATENALRNDPEFAKQLYEYFQNVIEDKGSYTSGRKDKWRPAFDQNEQQVLDALLAQEKRNSILRAAGLDLTKVGQAPAKGQNTSQYVLDFIEQHPELGLNPETDFAANYAGQAAYIAYNKLMQEKYKDDYDKYWASQSGIDDEKVPGMPRVSGIDDIATDTTLGEFLYSKAPEKAAPAKAYEKVCRCIDAVTKEVTETILPEGQECKCTGTKQQIPDVPTFQDSPHWSIPAKRNIARNALMNVNPASTNVVMPMGTQLSPNYEEYQTKVDQALAGQNALNNAINYGMAGPSNLKFSMMKNASGDAIRNAINAVSDVSARNVNTQNQMAAYNAQYDAANKAARAQALQNALNAQTDRRNTKIANINKRRYNTLGAMIDADKEMAQKQQANVMTPQYALDYDYGFITPTGRQKPFTGSGTSNFEDRVDYYMKKTGNYKDAVDAAWKESRATARNGGYVYTDMVFPFII